MSARVNSSKGGNAKLPNLSRAASIWLTRLSSKEENQMNVKTHLRHALLLAILSLMTACGGSSSSNNTTPATWSGIKQLGATSQTTIDSATATDASGNVYVVGYTTGGLNGNTLTGTQDAFVAKYNSAGVLQAVKQIGKASSATTASGVAVNGSTVYVAGTTYGGLNGNTLTGANDAYVAQYDFSGSTPTLVSVKQLGVASKNTIASGVAVNGTAVYVAGYTSGGLNGNTMSGNFDAFVAQYDFSGSTPTLVSVKQLGVATSDAFAKGIAVNGSTVYVAGTTNGGLNGNTVTGSYDTFVAKYDFSGSTPTLVSVKQLGVASNNTTASGVAVNGSTVYVAGTTYGGLNGNTLTGGNDAFVAQYDFSSSTPTLVSVKQLGVASSGTGAAGVAVNGSTVYVAGFTNGGLNGNTLTGTNDSFVAQYDFSGSTPTLVSVKQLGVASKNTAATGVAVNGSAVYVAGYTYGGLNGNTVTGSYDAFVAKYVSGVLQ
jgi:hypothetical protein